MSAGRHVPDRRDRTMRVSRIVTRSGVLGPATSYVVWTQGCDMACPGCIVPETHDRTAGTEVDVDVLAETLLTDPVPINLTVSGGEPFLQSAAVARLVERMRGARPELTVMVFSGYRLALLRRRRDPGTVRLLGLVDLLVDGAYVATQHASLRWRGSAGQTLNFLTPRLTELRDAPDVSQGVEIGIDAEGVPFLNGVPSTPHTREELERLLGSHNDPEGPVYPS